MRIEKVYVERERERSGRGDCYGMRRRAEELSDGNRRGREVKGLNKKGLSQSKVKGNSIN